MNRQTTTVMLSLLGIFSYAQAVTCKKGIQCGNTCISASYTCHVGGPVVAPVATPAVQTLTSPPLPLEPSGTYFGWSVADNSLALVVLSGRSTPVPFTIRYSKVLASLTPQDARTRVDRVLNDEVTTDAVILEKQNGSSRQWLAWRRDGSRGVVISMDPSAAGLVVHVSAFSSSGMVNVPDFLATTREAMLTQVGPAAASTATAPAAPAATGGLNLTINPDNMFTDPSSGNLVVAAQCQAFSFSITPSQAFSKITLTEKVNEPLYYSLDVTVDGKLRFTQGESLFNGPIIPILVGQQQAGGVVSFSYKPLYTTSSCKGVMTISLKVE